MLSNRANAICILEILREYSDAEHILSMREIIQKMKSIYDSTVDRRTVYSAVNLLKYDLGYEISVYEENKCGYYLQERELEPSEVRLLMDTVYTFDGIPVRQSEMLIDKLQKFLSCYQRKSYCNLKIIRAERRTPNKAVFSTIDLLDEAISKKVQVEFTYLQYDLQKRLMPQKQMRYLVNPYMLVFANGNYYLVCNYNGHDNISYYRVDKIFDVKIKKNSPTKQLPKNFDSFIYTRDKIYLFQSYPEAVTLRCDNCILNDVIERFNADVRLTADGTEHFLAHIKNTPGGMIFWLLQYLQYCEVLEPLPLREKIIEVLNKNKYQEGR